MLLDDSSPRAYYTLFGGSRRITKRVEKELKKLPTPRWPDEPTGTE